VTRDAAHTEAGVGSGAHERRLTLVRRPVSLMQATFESGHEDTEVD
jgi:hypothetical protein